MKVWITSNKRGDPVYAKIETAGLNQQQFKLNLKMTKKETKETKNKTVKFKPTATVINVSILC